MMSHCDGSKMESDEREYPPPFSLDGGLLSALRGETAVAAAGGNNIASSAAEGNRAEMATNDCHPTTETTGSSAEPVAMNVEEPPGPPNNEPHGEQRQRQQPQPQPTEETTRDVAILLTEMAEIASKEALPTLTPPPPPSRSPAPASASAQGQVFREHPATPIAVAAGGYAPLDPPPPPPTAVSPLTPRFAPRFSALCALSESSYQREKMHHHNHAPSANAPSPVEPPRVRAVSISSPDVAPRPSPPPAVIAPYASSSSYRFESYSIGGGGAGGNNGGSLSLSSSSFGGASPPGSPHCAAVRPRCFSMGDASENSSSNVVYIPSAPSILSSRRPLQPTVAGQVNGHRGRAPLKTTILRKKFSWKNYPELEAFLIANREEYLRHSTLNYTVQQKQYNNLLTERMLALAAENGYIFDEADFSFVTVRDRIRCYYKSYVQSLKKRGIIIGYAARKAGLVSETDLENSASTAGKIYLPANSLP